MNMKNLLISLGLAAGLTASAQTGIINYNEQSLLSGWNVTLTNGQAIGPGVTNQEYTTREGQIVFSGANPVINGIVNTNTVAADAFNTSGVTIRPDANGDYVANAAVHVYINNTNWIPIAVTNSQGQYFVGVQPTTNNYPFQSLPTPWVGWPLTASVYPAWQFPATTNLYFPLPAGLTTNILAFTFQSGWKYKLGDNTSITVWSPTNLWSFSIDSSTGTATGGSPVSLATNLPATFLQNGNVVRCSGITMSLGANALTRYIINSLSVGQPQ
jgi:hypothetical protein